jgi:hypothetical protein
MSVDVVTRTAVTDELAEYLLGGGPGQGNALGAIASYLRRWSYVKFDARLFEGLRWAGRVRYQPS